jgi:hypothetical protein
MHRRLHPEALTDANYWSRRPGAVGLNWDLITCHDLGVWDGISYRKSWSFVLEHLATAWGIVQVS